MSKPTTGKPERKDWKKEMNTFYSPKDIKRGDKLRIWARGRIDGKRGLVQIDEGGKVISPYCDHLAQLANKRIAAEWETCGNDVLALQPYLDKQNCRYEGALHGFNGAAKRVGDSEAAAAAERHVGDAGASSSVTERRKAFRAAKASAGHRATQQRCKGELDAIAEESTEALDDYLAREEIAMKHELMIKYEFAQKIDIFMRAAKPYLDCETLDFQPETLVTQPRTDYYALHPRYDFQRHVNIA
jgi:hypothetical protein